MGSLIHEFTKAYQHNFRHVSLSPQHQTQIKALQNFVEQLNRESDFKARLDKVAEAAPVLRIEDEEKHQSIFLLTYHEKSIHDVRVVLSPVQTRQPLYGHSEGYNMTREADRMLLMRDLGCFVARRAMELDLLRETVLKL
jgi:hypothetical protein